LSTDTPWADRTLGAVGIVLAILSAFFVSLAVDSFWLQHRIFDTDSVVATAAPLPKDPAVSTAVAFAAAEAVGDSDIDQRIEGALPDAIDFLAPTFAGFAADVVFDVTKSLVESDAFGVVWVAMIESTHTRALANLNAGPGEALEPVTLDLNEAADTISEQLTVYGIVIAAELEASLGEIVLIQAESLIWPNRIVDAFQTELWVYPLLAALLLAAAVVVDRHHSRPIQITGFSVAVAMVLSAAGLALARSSAIDGADTAINQAAVAVIWDAFATGYLPLAAATGAIGLLVGITTWWVRRVSSS
jgi:hypothetical protein